MNRLLEAVDESAAVELLHELGCTDGLPVIVPTPERVARMVLAGGLDGELVLGAMGPQLGAATVQAVATAAVMAGCTPDLAPVVLAAVRAVCQPEFDLTEMQATTHCTAPLVIVNGPVRRALGFNSSFGVFGPGCRANATVGRALRLAMLNIGGARPGVSDMALHGHPGKFTYCVAEDEEASPFEPLHVSRGYAAEDSVVTVVGAEAPHSVIFIDDADDPGSAGRLLRTLAGVIANVGSNNIHIGGRGVVTVVLNPDHAQVLARSGYDRAKAAAELAELATVPRAVLRDLSPGGGRGDGEVSAVRDPDDVLIIEAGGGGLYSMVMPSWCAGAHANRAVSQLIELDQACEVPGLR